ncbi:MAG TPA: rhomboid family intramembrane serine protease [Chitinophagaceae bacterium]|nr:rhomboid family intramembrane serine protease [Chitinophagaceae bacterium]
MEFSITLIIIIITCLVSFGGFGNQKLIDDLIFYPPAITQQKQWYRFFTCGLIHADIAHLAFNMISLYLFGDFVEKYFAAIFGEKGKILYLVMYVLALFFCLLPTFSKHKNDYYYRSLGASGAVSAVIFAGLLLEPRNRVGLFFIPPIIPGYVFGPLYLILSSVLEKKSRDNVNHSAHFWGAIFGIAFVVLMAYILKTDYQPIQQFIEKVKSDLGG